MLSREDGREGGGGSVPTDREHRMHHTIPRLHFPSDRKKKEISRPNETTDLCQDWTCNHIFKGKHVLLMSHRARLVLYCDYIILHPPPPTTTSGVRGEGMPFPFHPRPPHWLISSTTLFYSISKLYLISYKLEDDDESSWSAKPPLYRSHLLIGDATIHSHSRKSEA